MSKLFSVVDIETNGGYAENGKITEIAIFVTDGKNIISEFSTLINPECYIPPFIENLTGISNEMVEDAPKFYEVAKDIVEITKDTVFVAHNVRFDYNFIKYEFARLGYKYSLDTLCTLTLSRKFFKGFKSYSLGKLCGDLGITLENRHRAFGDARATVDLFKMIYEHDLKNYDGVNINGFPVTGINPNLDISIIDSLPEKYGIFYFYNASNEIIYIGRGKNIRSNVITFFKNRRNDKIKSQITDIGYETTGCDLITQIKASEEIMDNLPFYNRIKRTSGKWGIYYFEDENGYLRFDIINSNKANLNFLTFYSNKKNAQDALIQYCIEFKLCEKLCGLYQSAGYCFYYGIGECRGACYGTEPANEYNIRAEKLISKLNFNLKSAYIIINACDDNKICILSLKNYKYVGYCFIDNYESVNPDEIEDYINKRNETIETKQIILKYLNSSRNYKIIPNT